MLLVSKYIYLNSSLFLKSNTFPKFFFNNDIAMLDKSESSEPS